MSPHRREPEYLRAPQEHEAGRIEESPEGDERTFHLSSVRGGPGRQGPAAGSLRQSVAYLYYLLAQRKMGFIISCVEGQRWRGRSARTAVPSVVGGYGLVPVDGGKKALPASRHSG